VELTGMAPAQPIRPSSRWGLAQARRLWRLVLAVWLVSLAAYLPALLVFFGASGAALGELPGDSASIAPGDVALLLGPALAKVLRPLMLAFLSGCVALWAWTVLWHAGVVNWALWASGRRVRLGEVLGLGMVSWWRYARLSATALAVMVAAWLVVWAPTWSAVSSARGAMAEGRMVVLLGFGIVLTKLVGLVVWAATLRGAWLLGMPERRSVVVAWLLGLVGSFQTPLATFGTLLLWTVPVLWLSLLPLLIGMWGGGGPQLLLLGQLAAATRAFCWVGLFMSFAPVSGLVGGSGDEKGEPERG